MEKTRVVFRIDRRGKDKEVTAVFIDDQEQMNLYGCYNHIGQHSVCSAGFITKETRQATPEEYADLLDELENRVGYDLEVVTKHVRFAYR